MSDFNDEYFLRGLREWIGKGSVTHDLSHVRRLDKEKLAAGAVKTGTQLAELLRKRKAILGVFDEGCMGMYNAIIDDELLNSAGVFTRSGSASPRWSPRCATVSDEDAEGVRAMARCEGTDALSPAKMRRPN